MGFSKRAQFLIFMILPSIEAAWMENENTTRVWLQSDVPCDDPDCAGVCNYYAFMGGSCWHDRCTCHLAGSARHWGDPCDIDSCVGVCTNHGFDGGDCWYEKCACVINGGVQYRCGSTAVNAFVLAWFTFAALTLFLPF